MTDTPHIIRRGEIDILQIDNAHCSAEISLFGGQVLHWQPSGQKPVLWMSETTNYDGKTALRGGIPVCWPWFGPVENKGRHGLVRNRLWQLESYQERGDDTQIKLSIDLSEKDNPWPHPNRLEMQLTLGRTLEQTLTVQNNGDTPLCFAYALHNYFTVSHPNNIQIPAIKNGIYEDSLLNLQQQLDAGDKTYAGPIDRIYLCDKNAALLDTKFQRTINVEKTGSQHWVLWNPGEQALDIADIHASGENEYLCFESANTTDISLAPKTSLQFGQIISIT